MLTLLSGVASFRTGLIGLAIAASLAFGLWDYLALQHRSAAINQLTAEKAGLIQETNARLGMAQTAARESAAAVAGLQAELQRALLVLHAEQARAAQNAAFAAVTREKIKNANSDHCLGSAMLAYLGSVRADQRTAAGGAGSAPR